MAPFPDDRGVAGPFAGLIGESLVVAGGANFPDRMPWEGGRKVWYDQVWMMAEGGKAWTQVGQLPHPLAYGVSVSQSDGLVCIGGSDFERHYRSVIQLSLHGGKFAIKSLPDLPLPVANACGAMLDGTIYVAGGTTNPTATETLGTFLALDLSLEKPHWRTLDTWPGPPRMLGIAAVQAGAFYLMSGADLHLDSAGQLRRRYLSDAYQFRPQVGWQRVADLPHPVVAAPSPALRWGDSQILVLGGDDGKRVGFSPPHQHPGFSSQILSYNVMTNVWLTSGSSPAAHVTAPIVPSDEAWYQVSGEQRPGVRSPDIWKIE